MDNPALLKLATSRMADNTVILVFADSKFIPVLLNWLVGIDRLDIRNYLIVSLDQQLHDFLEQRGFPTFLSPLKGSLSDLWVLRMHIFHTLCTNGIHFIHSDADAFWLKNPIQDYFSQNDCQIIASQGTVWPPDVLEKHHFVLCCGLLYIRSCPQNANLINKMVTDIKVTGDDQVSLNRVIERENITWEYDISQAYQIRMNDRRFLCSREVIYGQFADKTLRIAVLPHHLFQRVHMPGEDAFVKHLVSDMSSPLSKFKEFDAGGCLFLSPDWQQIDFNTDTIERIRLPGKA